MSFGLKIIKSIFKTIFEYFKAISEKDPFILRCKLYTIECTPTLICCSITKLGDLILYVLSRWRTAAGWRARWWRRGWRVVRRSLLVRLATGLRPQAQPSPTSPPTSATAACGMSTARSCRRSCLCTSSRRRSVTQSLPIRQVYTVVAFLSEWG